MYFFSVYEASWGGAHAGLGSSSCSACVDTCLLAPGPRRRQELQTSQLQLPLWRWAPPSEDLGSLVRLVHQNEGDDARLSLTSSVNGTVEGRERDETANVLWRTIRGTSLA